jgi:truncated hemoglobin YjbI
MKDNIRNTLRRVLLEFEIPKKQVSTFMKLINTATRDGYLTGGQASAQYIMASAHEIADAFDALEPEEQKVFRDTYYKKFVDSIKTYRERF